MRRSAAALPPIAFLLCALAFALELRTVRADYDVDRAQPLIVVTYWQHDGAILAVTLFLAVAVAAIGYAALRVSTVRPAVWCAMTCAAALAVPAIFSSDVYAYAAYGSLLAHGVNPYVHGALALRSPLLDAAQWQWGNPLPACVYGPLFLAIAWIAAQFERFGAAAPLWFLRVAACAALVACAALIARAYWWLPPRTRNEAAALFALNPAVIWACAEGHNDSIAIAAALAGLALNARSFISTFAAALAAAFKAPALLAAWLPAWRESDASKRRAQLIGAACGSLACAALCIPLLSALSRNVAANAHYEPHFSPAFVLALALPAKLATAIVVLFAAIAIVALRRRPAAIAFAVWACVPNPYPWYGVWLIAFAAALPRNAGRAAIVAAGMLAMLRYAGEATSALSPAGEALIVLCAYGVPAVMLALGTDRMRRARRAIHIAAPSAAPNRLP